MENELGPRAPRTAPVATAETGRSPLGACIRYLMDGPHGNLIHSTVPPGMIGRACHFRTIDEYWYVLSGLGDIWRRGPDGTETVTELRPGVCVDIPPAPPSTTGAGGMSR